ncbi:MAG: transposase [Paramuribaculum sp.]|nr:transposase [Paramuribaculum sp.]
MKIVSLNGQMTFEEMKSSLERLPKTNRWVQLADTLPWAEYEKAYNRRLKNDTVGASNRPGRMVIAALIIKHKLNLSDEETILTIQENPYMQYMCGLTEYSDKPIFDPSLFVTIRKRITIDDINALTLELARKGQQKDKDSAQDEDGCGGDSPDTTRPTDRPTRGGGISGENINCAKPWKETPRIAFKSTEPITYSPQ